VKRIIGLAASTALLATMASPIAAGRTGAGCSGGRTQPATLSIDGNLYAVIRAPGERFSFGGSGPPVSTFAEALRLVRHLGFKGTNAELLHRLDMPIPGASFASGSGSSDFTFACRGTYRATALVRADHGSITGTRFWLRQGAAHVTRAFCMPAQWVPPGALVSVSFPVPLTRAAPVFEIDYDGDGKVDSVGPFEPGGAQFPSSERCD
jgi:hypothetical protein